LFGWIGLPQTTISYERSPRFAGKTKYSLLKMLRLAWVATLTFSTLPLKIATAMGITTAGVAVLYALYATTRWAVLGDTVKGWTTLILLIAGLGGMTLICLGIIGEYIGEIYNEVRKRPLYIIERTTSKNP
jgi:polyisoprenyl-phosphate glycosyltransferase